jgi:RNA-directed DNA polymerase
MRDLDPLFPVDDFAEAIGVSVKSLYYWAYVADQASHYSLFLVPKSSGGSRSISAPHAGLRQVQRRILRFLEESFRPRRVVHGFVKDRSVVSNAESHVGRRFVLNIDLKDFFPSINFGRVRGALMAKPMNIPAAVATLISRISCLDNQLPQGAPTSPCLSNIVCMKLDSELLRLARALGCTYSRYADDITISTHRRHFPPELATSLHPPYGTMAVLADPLLAIVQSNGFVVNTSKVRIYGRQASQRVTGIVVNDFANVERKFVRNIRGAIHAWERFGLTAAELQFARRYARRHRAPYRTPPSFKQHIVGKLRFLSMVRGLADPQFIRLAKRCRKLDPSLFQHALDGEEQVQRSVWVIESESESSQGTGFFVDGIGLVTCHHALASDSVAFHPSRPTEKFPITILKYDSHLDIAILEIPAATSSSLALATRDDLHKNQRIQLVGYPNYGSGDSLFHEWGHFLVNKVRSGVTYRVVSTKIAAGNSGGPILDEHYRVVGIAARGVKNLLSNPDEFELYAAVSVSHLRELWARK